MQINLHAVHVSPTSVTFTVEPGVKLPDGDIIPESITRGAVLKIQDTHAKLGLDTLGLGDQYTITIEAD